MTKRENLMALKEIPENAEYVDFLDGEIAALDRKAERAKVYKNKKSAAIEQDKEIILGVLGVEPLTVNEVLEKVEDSIAEVTRSKVVARLKILVDEEKVARVDVVNEDGKRVKGYLLLTDAGVIDNEAV